TQQLLLQWFRYIERVQRPDEILDEGVEGGVGHAHPVMDDAHRRTLIDAGSTGRLADLIDHGLPQMRDVGTSEIPPDPPVVSDIVEKPIDDGFDSRLAAELLIQRGRWWRRRRCRGHGRTERRRP